MQFDKVEKFCWTKLLRSLDTLIMFVDFEIGSMTICSMDVMVVLLSIRMSRLRFVVGALHSGLF